MKKSARKRLGYNPLPHTLVRCLVGIQKRDVTPVSVLIDNVNDPSAGSPTETLLRLLLPLNDQV